MVLGSIVHGVCWGDVSVLLQHTLYKDRQAGAQHSRACQHTQTA